MVERATRKVSKWVTTLAVRDPVRVPPDIRGAAYIVAVVRALVLDDSLTARDDYQEIVATLAPEVQAVRAEAAALVSNTEWLDRATETGKGWLDFLPPGGRNLAPQMLGAQDIFHKLISQGVMAAYEATDALATEFVRRWLFGSETGRRVVWALATIDAAGVDPLALDWSRAERSETWQLVYGQLAPRASRRKHKNLVEQLRKQGWRTLKDPETLATANDWVECYHITGGLSAWLLAQGKGYDALGTASRRFEPLERALGIRKKPGRPPRTQMAVQNRC